MANQHLPRDLVRPSSGLNNSLNRRRISSEEQNLNKEMVEFRKSILFQGFENRFHSSILSILRGNPEYELCEMCQFNVILLGRRSGKRCKLRSIKVLWLTSRISYVLPMSYRKTYILQRKLRQFGHLLPKDVFVLTASRLSNTHEKKL